MHGQTPFLPAGFSFFFYNDTATTEIYTLSLHDALPIYCRTSPQPPACRAGESHPQSRGKRHGRRSEEHTSELQSHSDLVCRLLLEKKKLNDRHLPHPNLERQHCL